MLILYACQFHEQETELPKDVSSISVSKSNGYGGINDRFFITIQDDPSKVLFRKIINNAQEGNQRIGMVAKQPDFDVLIRFEDGSTYGLNLILEDKEKQAMFAYVGHENNSYSISANDTLLLRNLFDQ